jgi:hypothetical protein
MSGVIIPSRLYDNHHTHTFRPPETSPIVTSPCRTRHSIVFPPCGLRIADYLPHPCVLWGQAHAVLCATSCPRCLKTGPSARLFPNVACGRVLVKVPSMQISWIGFDPRSEARKYGSGLNSLGRACVRVTLTCIFLDVSITRSGRQIVCQITCGSRVSS